MAVKRSRRSISDEEIALIRAMLRRGIDKTTIQAYFTHPDRRVNFGRITNIERDGYGPGIVAATDDELDKFLEGWRTARGAPIQNLAEAAVDLSTLSPIDPKRLLALFEHAPDLAPRLRDGETEEIECKLSFHGPNHERVLKAVAAMANNRGGYILFGIRDDDCEIVGLKDQRFTDLDPNQFSMAFRSAMEPMPRVEIGHFHWEGKLVGALYIHAEADRPIIAIKDEGTYRSGSVYYRYPGESRGIGGAEFRRILLERERKVRTEAAEVARKTIELGNDAAVLDLATGKVEGRSAALYLSPELLPKIQFIREGQFSPSAGAATLKLIGDVEVAHTKPNEAVRERIVRQGITDADVLRNFLDMETVQYPAEYILHGCHTSKRWLPLFYYAAQTGVASEELIALLTMEETTLDASRGWLIDRMQGRLSARASATSASRQMTEQVRQGVEPQVKTLAEVRKTALALQGFDDSSIPVKAVLTFLKCLVTRARALGSSDPGTEIRRTAAWIDELYFRPRSHDSSPSASQTP